MTLYCRSCVSVSHVTVCRSCVSMLHDTVLQACVSVLHVTMMQVLFQCVTCHCVSGPVSVCYMSLCYRSCVSVFELSVLQDMCQCAYMSPCYRTCVSVFTCLCVTGPVSVCLHVCVTGPVSVCLHVSVLHDLCQCVYMSLCYRTCVSVFTCLCVTGPVSVCLHVCVTGPVSVCLHVCVLQDLCQCVGARDLQEAVDRCLCGDRMPDTAYLHSSHTPVPQSLWSSLRDALRHRSTHMSGQHALGQLALWWHRLGRDGNMTRTSHDRLLARSVIFLNKLITQR